MANENPIHLDKRPTEPTMFNIENEHKDTMIYVTVKIELKEKGWQYAAFHNVSLKGKDIFPNKIPEPVDLKLDYGKNLHKKKCSVQSHVSRFSDEGSEETPVIVKFSLIIEAGDKLLNVFTKESDTNNPSNFYSFIIFNLLP